MLSRVCRSCAVFALVLLAGSSVALAQHGAFDPDGFSGHHPMHTGPANEHVDPLTGNANIVTTDLVLRGNAGFNLPITRWYNSQIYYALWYGDHDIEDSWAGIGWQMHFGRVIHLDSIEPGATIVQLPLGGGGPLYRTSRFPEGWMTKDFALYNRGTHTLKLPNGLVYKFGYEGTDTLEPWGRNRHVTEIKDPFGNRVTFEYHTRVSESHVVGVKRIVQYIDGTQVREVTFGITSDRQSLATMTYNGRTWRYEHDPFSTGGHTVLRRVWYPGNTGTNANWGYTYYGGTTVPELTILRYPSGGTVRYTYASVARQAQGQSRSLRVVTTRRTSGPNIAGGTWTFAYDQTGNRDWTYVTGPTTTVKYRFWGVGFSSDFSAWIKGALRDRRVEENGVLIEREVPTYLKSETISADAIPPTSGGSLWADGAVWNPLLETSTITRGGQSWTRTYTYRWGNSTYNDFNQAVTIEEEGERTRTITRAFHFNSFTPWLPGRFSWEKVTVGGQTVVVSDPNYDSTGFATSANINGVTTTFTRFSNGNVATATDANGNQTSFQYASGVVSRIQTPELLTTRTINVDGTIASETVGSLTTTYTYDAIGRVTRIRPPGAGTLTAETQISYAGTTWPLEVIRTTRGSSTSEVWVDGFGRTRLTIGPDGVRQSVTRDAEGRVTFTSYPHTSTASVPGTTMTYDGLGRRLTATAADGSVTRYAYASNDVTITDAENRATTYTYQAAGHPDSGVLASVTDAADKVTTYGYNIWDTLTRVSVPGVPDRTWVYDAAKNCLTSDTQPESGTTTYTRDALCNSTQITDAAGQVFTLTYDGNNRLTARNAPGSTSDLTITYDSNGRVMSQALPAATTSFTYDGASRLATRSDTFNALSWQSAYEYDTLDRLTELTYPSGRIVGYTYDSSGRLAGVTQQGSIFADQFSYNDSGQLDSFRSGTVVQTLSYDSRKRVQRLTAGADLDLTYTYDRTSSVLGIADGRPGEDQSFDYDALGRLTDATGPWGQLAWTYDAAGNRLSETGSGGSTSYSYNAATQRLTSTSGGTSESFSYDNIGRMTADGRGTYSYTPTSRLATATTTAGSATYGYDPDDLRIVSVVNGTARYTIRGAGQQVLSEYDESTWSRDLIYAGGALVGSVRASGSEHHGADALGSMRVVFDDGGAVVARSDYLPFGEALNPSGELPTQRFTGQERDEEGGLDYFNARMYQPRTGRLNALDPLFHGLFNPQGWNRYAYVLNTPTSVTDPSGAKPTYHVDIFGGGFTDVDRFFYEFWYGFGREPREPREPRDPGRPGRGAPNGTPTTPTTLTTPWPPTPDNEPQTGDPWTPPTIVDDVDPVTRVRQRFERCGQAMATRAIENVRMTTGVLNSIPGPGLIPGLPLALGAGGTVQQTFGIGPTALEWGWSFATSGKVAGFTGAVKNFSLAGGITQITLSGGIAIGSVAEPVLALANSRYTGFQCR